MEEKVDNVLGLGQNHLDQDTGDVFQSFLGREISDFRTLTCISCDI